MIADGSFQFEDEKRTGGFFMERERMLQTSFEWRQLRCESMRS